MDITHRFVETNGIRMHIAEAGTGPTVVLCHGFPECWYSWRYQLVALAEAGFHVVAPDQRGYGETDQPPQVTSYTMLHLVGDLVGLLDALGVASAAIVGHDWGSSVAWNAALIRPDRFNAIAALSVPVFLRAPAPPTSLMPQTENDEFYQLYYQQPGRAEADFDPDPRDTVRRFMQFGAGENVPQPRVIGGGGVNMIPRTGGFFSKRPSTFIPNPHISDADFDEYGRSFRRGGFRGPLNWYRNIDLNWELMAPYAGAKWQVPALYIVGDRDVVLAFGGADKALKALPERVPQLRETLVLEGCGHWTQQERPDEVNAALLSFLRSARP